MSQASSSSFFNRVLLPGLIFKGVVIGGGYATGRELVQFFFPSGPQGGLLALGLVTVLFSLICTVTFLFAQVTNSFDYKAFFKHLLGPFWVAFEVAYALIIVLVLSVLGASAGEIGQQVLGWPNLVGALLLGVAIAIAVGFGNETVERMFKYTSTFLYAVYAIFIVLIFTRFGADIERNLMTPRPTDGWVIGGLTYNAYNVIGAVAILPALRHLVTRKDAIVAGVLCGPLAALPAILFFLCMMAFYPQIGNEALPSNYMLERLNTPLFQLAFQAMIFIALLETGVSLVHAVNQRVDSVYVARGSKMPDWTRVAFTLGMLGFSIFVAAKVGLVELIGKGYTASAYVFMVIFVVPVLTWGVWKVYRSWKAAPAA